MLERWPSLTVRGELARGQLGAGPEDREAPGAVEQKPKVSLGPGMGVNSGVTQCSTSTSSGHDLMEFLPVSAAAKVSPRSGAPRYSGAQSPCSKSVCMHTHVSVYVCPCMCVCVCMAGASAGMGLWTVNIQPLFFLCPLATPHPYFLSPTHP